MKARQKSDFACESFEDYYLIRQNGQVIEGRKHYLTGSFIAESQQEANEVLNELDAPGMSIVLYRNAVFNNETAVYDYTICFIPVPQGYIPPKKRR